MKQPYYLIGLLSIFLAGFWIQSHIFLNWDTSWLMELATRIHDNGFDKNNFIEINTPMSIYLYYPAVLIMQWFGLAKIVALRIYVFTLILISLGLCNRLLHLIFPDIRIINWIMLCLTVIFMLTPAVQFSQREHLFILLIFPYLFAAMLRIEKKYIPYTISISAGIFAAIGFAIKPHFILTAIFIELFILYKTKKWACLFRTETTIIFTALYFYLCSIIYLQPGYITTVIPFAHKYYYSGYQMNYTEFLFDLLLLYCIAISCFYLFLKKYSALNSILCITIIANIITYLIQGIPSFYRLYPAFACSLLLAAILYKQELITKEKIFNIIVFIILFSLPIFAIMKFTISSIDSRKHSHVNNIISEVNSMSLHGKVLFISTSPPMLIIDYIPKNTFFILQPKLPFWILASIVATENNNTQPILDYAQSIAMTIKNDKPAIIFVDSRIMLNQIQQPFDYLHFFMKNSEFQHEWSAYKKIGQVTYFQLYKRK